MVLKTEMKSTKSEVPWIQVLEEEVQQAGHSILFAHLGPVGKKPVSVSHSSLYKNRNMYHAEFIFVTA